jgi:5-carboxymethyl-2-hydroxymuconate isomerase
VPQISIEYSSNLGGSFDARGLAARVHELVAATVDTELANCKTRIIELSQFVIGDGGEDQAMIHVDIRILSGRPEATKRQLGEKVMAALQGMAAKPPELKVQLTVEVRELDRENYHKQLV